MYDTKAMKNKITAREKISYFATMLGANLLGSIAIILILSILSKSNDRNTIIKNYRLFAVIFALIGIGVTCLVTFLYFRSKLPHIFVSDIENADSIKVIFKNFCSWVLPGEVIRLILATLPTKPGPFFSYRFFDGFFAMPANIAYDWFYLMPQKRLAVIRESGYTFTDNALFLLIYLIYFSISIAVLFLLFKQLWKENETAKKNEVKIRMDYNSVK